MRATIWTLGWAALAAAAEAAHGAPPRPPGKPPAPVIAPGPYAFAAFAGHPARVRLTWTAVPNVARYRARWAQAGAAVDVELPGAAAAFEREVSAPGHHQLTLIAVDAAGNESAPVEVGIDVMAVAAIAPGGTEPAPPSASAGPSVPVFAVGARFRSPGLTCRLGEEPAAAEATAREVGVATLRCGAEPGPRVEVPVVIAPVIVDGPKQPIPRGTVTKVHLTVASVAPLGARLDVDAQGDVSLGEITRTEHGVDVAVTPREGATAAALVVRGGAAPLGRVELAFADRLEAPAPAPTPASGGPWLGVDVGYHLGVFVPGGDPPTIGSYDREMTPRPIGGMRVGIFPTHRVGGEAELALSPPDYGGGHRTWLVSARAHLAARVLDVGDFGARLVGGAGVLNTTGAVHYGGAFTVETRGNLWLRFQVLHAITAARDAGYTHCLELQLGVITRFGRRDRGP